MRITSEMNLNEVLEIDEDRMLRTLTWIAPELAKLQSPRPLRSVVGTVTVEQAARLANVPIEDMLYALNLAAGESQDTLLAELRGAALAGDSL
jgi:hypothetical protein